MTLPAVLNIPPMPPLGNDTVTFLKYLPTTGVPDGMGEIAVTPQRTDVTGCGGDRGYSAAH
jgi:hypothetical protein